MKPRPRNRPRPARIIIVEPFGPRLEAIAAPLARRLAAQLTCVATGEACLDDELIRPRDLAVVAARLPDMSGLDLARRLRALSTRPVILLADSPTADELLEAMRIGVHDVFAHDAPIDDLISSAAAALRALAIRRRRAARTRRLRKLVRRMIRERRDLDRRTNLICRDLVGAHRRLVTRVLAFEHGHSPPNA